MIESSKLKNLIDTVMFYGSPKSPLWFVGLEETDGGTEENVELYIKRLDMLDENDSISLRDAVGLERYFPSDSEDLPELQRTWYGYTKLRFAVKGLPFSPNKLRHYQGHGLGDKNDGENCLLELLPLPRINRKESWFYEDISDLDYLKTHNKYMQVVAPLRVEAIYNRIELHKPKNVVFFGKDCRDRFWNRLSLTKILIEDGETTRPVYWDKIGETLLIFTHHPAANGITDEYWQGLGDFIADRSATT